MKKRWLLIPLVFLTVPVFAFQARLVPVFGAPPSVEDRERFIASDAYNPEAGVFQNRRPELFVQMREDMEFFPMLGKWFTERVDGRPAGRLPERQPDMQAFLAPGQDTRVIWFGHSTFLLNVAGTIVLVDPVFSDTAAPVGFTAKRFQPPVLSLDRLPPVDIVLISWPYVHMQPAETIQAFKDVKASRLMPVHWGMFELAFHTWYAPVASLSQLADQEGIDLVTPMLGEMIIVDDSLETSRWWEKVDHADS